MFVHNLIFVKKVPSHRFESLGLFHSKDMSILQTSVDLDRMKKCLTKKMISWPLLLVGCLFVSLIELSSLTPPRVMMGHSIG